MSMKTIKDYTGRRMHVHPKVWAKCLRDARKDKRAAHRPEASDESKQCGYMIEQYRRWREMSVEDIAANSYRYFYYRAHALVDGHIYRGQILDPAAAEEWFEITGRKPRFRRFK